MGSRGFCQFEASVKGANRAPTFASSPQTQIILGQQYVYNVKAQDPDNDDLTFMLLQVQLVRFDAEPIRCTGIQTP